MDPRNYRPPRWLRNPHVQSVLSSSGLRRLLARKRRQLVESTAESHLLECSDGVLLQGFLTRQTTQAQSSGLVVLLHGWEGSARSNYVLHTAARLLQSGFDVFRLNFRDHGDTHHLNPDLFSSNKLGEVVDAVSEVARRFEPSWMGVVGYSLGGNFALRVGLQSRSAHLPLQHVIAICPVVSPPAGLQAIEDSPWFYEYYFMRKWTQSLRRKQVLYPDRFRFSKDEFNSGIRELTRVLVERHTPLQSLEAYLDSYSIAADRLASMPINAHILTAADDPVIPLADFLALQLPPRVTLDVAEHGGHCGFLDGWHLRGFAEEYVAQRLLQACSSPPGDGLDPGCR